MERLKEIEARMAQIVEESAEKTGEELDQLAEEMDNLKAEQAEIRKAAEDVEKRSAIAAQLEKGKIAGKKIDETKGAENIMDIESKEYRNAFKAYVETGVMAEEFRSVAMTKDNGAVIPPTVLNEIMQKLESYGNILPLVRKMHYAAGLVVPQSTVAAKAEWLQEGAAIEPGAKATTKISFGAYELGASLGISYHMQVQSLSAFEQAIVNDIVKAMTKALEEAIVKGDGSAKPHGIANTAVADAKRNVTLNKKLGFQDIVNIVKAIPSAYRQGATLTMNEATFFDFQAITDANGQPVAKVNFGTDGEPSYMLYGRKVVVTDFLPSLEEAAAGDVVAYAVRYDDYILNEAAGIDLVSYTDYPTRNKVYQSVGLFDGKLADQNGLVLVHAAAAAKA